MRSPRWLRERRRAESLAARPEALGAAIAARLAPTWAARPGGVGRPAPTVGSGPPGAADGVELADFLDREPMPEQDWARFSAAIEEGRQR